jgi:transcriptional regulator with XRE-family HTH domain
VPDWTLGWRMNRALAHAGVSVQEMASDLGVSRGTLSRWMSDHGAAPRAIYLKQWALRTGVDYGWLIGRPDDGGTLLPRPDSNGEPAVHPSYSPNRTLSTDSYYFGEPRREPVAA